MTDVYRNLNKHCVSVREHGKIVGYHDAVVVRNVEFRVQPAGVQRIRRTGQREVVAYARGTVTPIDAATTPLPQGAQPVHFNPHTADTFVLDDGTPVTHADMLVIHSPKGSWVINPRAE